MHCRCHDVQRRLLKEGEKLIVLVASADKTGPLSGKAELKSLPNLNFSVQYGDHSEALTKSVAELEKVGDFGWDEASFSPPASRLFRMLLMIIRRIC